MNKNYNLNFLYNNNNKNLNGQFIYQDGRDEFFQQTGFVEKEQFQFLKNIILKDYNNQLCKYIWIDFTYSLQFNITHLKLILLCCYIMMIYSIFYINHLFNNIYIICLSLVAFILEKFFIFLYKCNEEFQVNFNKNWMRPTGYKKYIKNYLVYFQLIKQSRFLFFDNSKVTFHFVPLMKIENVIQQSIKDEKLYIIFIINYECLFSLSAKTCFEHLKYNNLNYPISFHWIDSEYNSQWLTDNEITSTPTMVIYNLYNQPIKCIYVNENHTQQIINEYILNMYLKKLLPNVLASLIVEYCG